MTTLFVTAPLLDVQLILSPETNYPTLGWTETLCCAGGKIVLDFLSVGEHLKKTYVTLTTLLLRYHIFSSQTESVHRLPPPTLDFLQIKPAICKQLSYFARILCTKGGFQQKLSSII
jgi:hypothetical protein